MLDEELCWHKFKLVKGSRRYLHILLIKQTIIRPQNRHPSLWLQIVVVILVDQLLSQVLNFVHRCNFSRTWRRCLWHFSFRYSCNGWQAQKKRDDGGGIKTVEKAPKLLDDDQKLPIFPKLRTSTVVPSSPKTAEPEPVIPAVFSSMFNCT